jgi:hypothetical protein
MLDPFQCFNTLWVSAILAILETISYLGGNKTQKQGLGFI